MEVNLIALIVLFFLFFLPWTLHRNEKSFTRFFTNRDFFDALGKDPELWEVISTSNDTTLMTMRIILDSENIPFHILNDSFHNLYPGPYIWGHNTASIYVRKSHHQKAHALLSDYFAGDDGQQKVEKKTKLRNIIEVFILGWIIHDTPFRGNTYLRRQK